MITFSTASSGGSWLKAQVRIKALARRAGGAELVCFSRLELLAWGFIPKHFGLTIKNLIIELVFPTKKCEPCQHELKESARASALSKF